MYTCLHTYSYIKVHTFPCLWLCCDSFSRDHTIGMVRGKLVNNENERERRSSSIITIELTVHLSEYVSCRMRNVGDLFFCEKCSRKRKKISFYTTESALNEDSRWFFYFSIFYFYFRYRSYSVGNCTDTTWKLKDCEHTRIAVFYFHFIFFGYFSARVWFPIAYRGKWTGERATSILCATKKYWPFLKFQSVR